MEGENGERGEVRRDVESLPVYRQVEIVEGWVPSAGVELLITLAETFCLHAIMNVGLLPDGMALYSRAGQHRWLLNRTTVQPSTVQPSPKITLKFLAFLFQIPVSLHRF